MKPNPKVATLQLTYHVARTLANMLAGLNVEPGDKDLVARHVLMLLHHQGIEPHVKAARGAPNLRIHPTQPISRERE